MFVGRDIAGKTYVGLDNLRKIRFKRGVVVLFLRTVPYVAGLVYKRLVGDILVLWDAAHLPQGFLQKLYDTARLCVQPVLVRGERIQNFRGLTSGLQLVLDARKESKGSVRDSPPCRAARWSRRHSR